MHSSWEREKTKQRQRHYRQCLLSTFLPVHQPQIDLLIPDIEETNDLEFKNTQEDEILIERGHGVVNEGNIRSYF